MMDAVMYGMMPRAKIVSRRKLPPLNKLKKSLARRTKPRARSTSGVTVSPAVKALSCSTFTTENAVPKGLWKPRFGMRRCSGIWPPSNPRRREYPARDFCPLFPAPAVLPSFEPMPRPTRTLRWRAPRGGFKFDRLAAGRSTEALAAFWSAESFVTILRSLLHHFHQVPHLPDHTAHGRRVVPLDNLVHFPQAQPSHRLTHVVGAHDKAAHSLNP